MPGGASLGGQTRETLASPERGCCGPGVALSDALQSRLRAGTAGVFRVGDRRAIRLEGGRGGGVFPGICPRVDLSSPWSSRQMGSPGLQIAVARMLARQLRTAVEDHQQRVTRQSAGAAPAHSICTCCCPCPMRNCSRDPTIPRALAGFGGTGQRRPEGVFDSAISAKAVAASGHKHTGCRAGRPGAQ